MSDLDEMLDLIKRHREVAVLGSFNFNADSVAVVAGAYKGDTIAFLRGLYDMYVVGYEPQDWAFKECEQRFHGDKKVELSNYGIGVRTEGRSMGEYGNDAASFVPDPAARTHGFGQLYDVVTLVPLIMGFDLAVFNMEGYEYELLPYMAEKGLLQKINHLVIQFHDMDVSAYDATQELLRNTHMKRWEHANWAHWTWQRWDAQP